jgi:hypothetical protein
MKLVFITFIRLILITQCMYMYIDTFTIVFNHVSSQIFFVFKLQESSARKEKSMPRQDIVWKNARLADHCSYLPKLKWSLLVGFLIKCFSWTFLQSIQTDMITVNMHTYCLERCVILSDQWLVIYKAYTLTSIGLDDDFK